MKPERYAEVREAFLALIELSSESRNERLRAIQARDAELAEEVRSLLDQSESDCALDRPIGNPETLESIFSNADAPPAPQRLGPYRILGRLGSGGMGQVYEAEQDFPRRVVALKVLPPALATPNSVQRLRREAELLGRLAHPGIAKIYDAGTLLDPASGSSPLAYIAMERVTGLPLDTATAHLPPRERLQVFIQICEAVEHAHDQSIVHRDLKPSNILIDDRGDPIVLDFGIGRHLDREAMGQSLRTETGAVLGTLAYMSPEQVAGEVADERADVYALGVILYELISGQLPLDPRSTSVAEATRRIRDDEPLPLSSHDSQWRGDLDVITSKALAKDLNRRYPSASELRRDVERFLSNEPIRAWRPSVAYQLKKFAKRNRALSVALGVVLLGLTLGIVGLAGGLHAAFRAIDELEEERQSAQAAANLAKEEAQRALATRSFLFHLLRSGLPDRTLGESVTVLQILERTEGEVETFFSDAPLLRAWAHQVLGQCFFELGDSRRALNQLEHALELRETHGSVSDPELYQVLDGLARTQLDLGQYEQAEARCRRALAARSDLMGPKHSKTLTSRDRLGHILNERERWREAEILHRENTQLFASVYGEAHPQTAGAKHNLATCLFSQGRYAEAQLLYDEVLAYRRDELGPEHPQTLVTSDCLAMTLLSLDQAEPAVALLEETLKSSRRVYPTGHRRTLDLEHHLAAAYRRVNRLDESEALYSRLLGVYESQFGPDHPRTQTLRTNLVVVLCDLEITERAVSVGREAVTSAKRHSPSGSWITAVALSNYGRALKDSGRIAEAAATFLEALELCESRLDLGPNHYGPAVIRCNYSRCLVELGRADEAKPLVERSLELLERELGPSHRYSARAREILAEISPSSHTEAAP